MRKPVKKLLRKEITLHGNNKTINEMTMTGTTILIILVFGFFLFRIISKFRNELKTDNEELKNQNLEDKFHLFVEGLNGYCYQGLGKITKIDKQALSIYKENSCQIVTLQYGTGILTIIWKFKYFQQEMVYQRNLPDARNSTDEWQKNALELIISEFIEQYKKHEAKVNASGIAGQKLSEFGISQENFQKTRDFLK